MDNSQSAIEGAVSNVQKTLADFHVNITTAFNQMYTHVESMAAHIIVLEAIVGELARQRPVDAAKVEAYVTQRIVDGTNGVGKPEETVAVAKDIMKRVGIGA